MWVCIWPVSVTAAAASPILLCGHVEATLCACVSVLAPGTCKQCFWQNVSPSLPAVLFFCSGQFYNCTTRQSLVMTACDNVSLLSESCMWNVRDVRKPGEPGRYIQDDPKKYPGKENMGPLSECLPSTLYSGVLVQVMHTSGRASSVLACRCL